jgi:hypothetical protein
LTQTFENAPIFIKEDAVSIVNDPKMAEAVPIWRCTAERIATGSRRRVPEDGPDTWHSDDEATEDVEADKLTGMYTAEMDPKLGPKTLSASEAAHQRSAAQALKEYMSSRFSTSTGDVSSDFGNSIINSPQSSRKLTPVNSDNEDEMTEDQKKLLKHPKKSSSIPRCTSAPGTAPPRKTSGKVGNTGTRSRAVPEPTSPTQEQKAVASPEAPMDQPKGAKVLPPTKGQQVSRKPTDGRHPMTTRSSEGSRAGGFRPGVGGSGQKDMCVASSHPSQT